MLAAVCPRPRFGSQAAHLVAGAQFSRSPDAAGQFSRDPRRHGLRLRYNSDVNAAFSRERVKMADFKRRSLRFIHSDELSSQPDAEEVLDGAGPWELAPGILAIATPGHTQGHGVLLFEERFLFTGDHLAWDRDTRRLSAFEDYCWYPCLVRPNRWNDWRPIGSSGYCRATASACIYRLPRCRSR